MQRGGRLTFAFWLTLFPRTSTFSLPSVTLLVSPLAFRRHERAGELGTHCLPLGPSSSLLMLQFAECSRPALASKDDFPLGHHLPERDGGRRAFGRGLRVV